MHCYGVFVGLGHLYFSTQPRGNFLEDVEPLRPFLDSRRSRPKLRDYKPRTKKGFMTNDSALGLQRVLIIANMVFILFH
jgi:hypothetical protein